MVSLKQLSLAVVIAVAAAPAHAGVSKSIAEIDKDNDGLLSKSEVQAANGMAFAFYVADFNEDGLLSKEERKLYRKAREVGIRFARAAENFLDKASGAQHKLARQDAAIQLKFLGDWSRYSKWNGYGRRRANETNYLPGEAVMKESAILGINEMVEKAGTLEALVESGTSSGVANAPSKTIEKKLAERNARHEKQRQDGEAEREARKKAEEQDTETVASNPENEGDDPIGPGDDGPGSDGPDGPGGPEDPGLPEIPGPGPGGPIELE